MAQENQVISGDSMVFRFDVTCPAGKWCNMTVAMKGDSEDAMGNITCLLLSATHKTWVPVSTDLFAVGARMVSTGILGYVPPPWAVERREGDYLNLEFGTVKNPSATEDAKGVMEVIYATKEITQSRVLLLPSPKTVGQARIIFPNGLTIMPNVSILQRKCIQ